MLLLGIDVGTSSVKVSVVDAQTQQCICSAQYPETESDIIAQQPGWAEQSPDMWWEHVQLAILKLHAQRKYNPKDITAIGIAYQMHGLVMVDAEQRVLRNSIIWCDSRVVELGDKAFEEIGREKCLLHLLNSPGNFTASKLAWVKQNEPDVFAKADKIMLPGDFIAMKLTGEISTSIAALSEGIFWDFQQNELSKDIFGFYGFSESLIPQIRNVFTEHGRVSANVSATLSLKEGIPVSYKAGDQPNNALSLNVLQPGEVAATAGTSGVIYGVSNQLTYDNESRVNTFAHVNYTTEQKRLGVLLCINGTGILNRWIKNIAGESMNYKQMNDTAKPINAGSDGLIIFPFGNGAERMLNNKIVQAHMHNIDFNKHSSAHLFRAAQEGIAFAFRYGLDIMRENGMNPQVIRAGKANMFLSDVFTQSFVNVNNVAVEFYEGDGSFGAAIGAGIGTGIFTDVASASTERKPIAIAEPKQIALYEELYSHWKEVLKNKVHQTEELNSLI
jgi:xylulokinase